MKAVKKFKNAIARKRPRGMESILGKDTRIVQPPVSMDPTDFNRPPLLHKTRSVDTHDRRAVEGALVTEGLHRDISLDKKEGPIEKRDDTAISTILRTPTWSSTIRSEEPDSSSPESPKRDLKADPKLHRFAHAHTFPQIGHQGKGQAHDPLEDHLYLNLGPGISSRPPSPPAVSESPPPAGIDIYETAYRKEVERLRAAQGRSATLFLTRRVEKMESSLRDHGLIKGATISMPSKPPAFNKIIQAARAHAAEDVASDANDSQQEGDEDHAQQAVAGAPQSSEEESNPGAQTIPQKSFSKLSDGAKSIVESLAGRSS